MTSHQPEPLWPPTCHRRWMNEACEPGLISVIIPTYNRSSMVTEAMDSVWRQTYRPIEMIVVDDGSIDNTAEVVEKWRLEHAADPDFTLRYLHQDNGGAPVARNHGLIESKGEFIQMLDSDDLLLPEKFSLSIEEFNQDQDLDMVFSPYIVEYSDGSTGVDSAVAVTDRNPDKTTLLINAHLLWTASTVHRRHIAVQGGPWNEQLLCCQEAEWQPRTVMHINKAVQLSRPQAVYRRHNETTISGSRAFSPRHIQSRMEAIKSRYRTLRAAGLDDPEAYQALAFNCISCARAMLPAGAPRMVSQLLDETQHIWTPYRRYRLAARCWRLTAVLPVVVTGNIFKLISKIRHAARFLRLKLKRKRLATG